jgi:UDP-N-acetylglucosamine acyltransferase
MSNAVNLAGHVQVGDWAIFSGYAGAHQFCRIGAHAFIANNTAVLQDIPPYVLAAGQPAEPRAVNIEGLKRRGFTEEQTRAIRNAFRVLYRSELRLEEASAQLRELAREQPVLECFAAFITASTRGLAR